MDTHSNLHTPVKELLARTLIDLRSVAGLTQAHLARRLGWARSVASRIESAEGALPDLTSLARYARTCDVEAVLIFGSSATDGLRVHSAATLRATRHSGYYQRFDPEALFEFARALRAVRKAVALSQPELATRARWSHQFVSRLETSLCARLPNLATLIRYACACQVAAGLVFAKPHGSPCASSSAIVPANSRVTTDAMPLAIATTDIATPGGGLWVGVRAVTLETPDSPVSFEALMGRLITLPFPNVEASSVRIRPLS